MPHPTRKKGGEIQIDKLKKHTKIYDVFQKGTNKNSK